MQLHAVQDPVESDWPEAGARSVVFLLDGDRSVERRLMLDWITRRRPGRADTRALGLPTARMPRWSRQGAARRLQRLLEESGDPMLVPLRVVWQPRVRGGRRSVRLLDFLTFGDPRDPGRLRQEWILRFHPERALVVAGDPAPVSDLHTRWAEARTHSPDNPAGLAEFVMLQAGLALERAERRIRGNRYKVPRFLREDLLSRSSFQVSLLRLADRVGEDTGVLYQQASKYLKEIAATHSPYVIDLVTGIFRILITMAYHRRILYDRAELAELAEYSQQHSLVFLPAHRSNLDFPVLTYVLYENGLPPNHTAAGDNMNFFPVGPLIRRAGIFFIRRSFKDNEPYKFMLRQYVDYLLSKRFPLQWFMEGGRSRSGKLRPPRFGLLSYVADSFRRGSCEDAVIIPVAIAYDQIQDIGAYTVEQRGGIKERESLSWLVKTVRSLRRRYGRISVRFGAPLFLSERLNPDQPGTESSPDADSVEVQKLAFEVGVRINRATPITPISLVTMALLGERERALTVGETMEAITPYLEYAAVHDLPATEPITLDTPERVQAALEALREHGVVSRFDAALETVYSIEPEQHLSAAFYRNTIIHFFLSAAVAELALMRASEPDQGGVIAFWDEVWELRELLKFEFYFPDKHEFAAEVGSEVARVYPGWVDAIEAGNALAVVQAFRPHLADWVLRPFVEAYRVVADTLERIDYRQEIDRKEFLAECMALGRQYRLQRKSESPESVSTVLFDVAFRLAEHRRLLDPGGPEQLERRRAFASEIREVLRRMDALAALEAAKRAGLPGGAA